MSKTALKRLNDVRPGDLVCVHWTDASIGKSSHSGARIEIPVESWGVYVGLLGGRSKHIVLAQNNFMYADGLFDVDYTAIPLSWSVRVEVIVKGYLSSNMAQGLLNSFLTSRLGLSDRLVKRRIRQKRLSCHG